MIKLTQRIAAAALAIAMGLAAVPAGAEPAAGTTDVDPAAGTMATEPTGATTAAEPAAGTTAEAPAATDKTAGDPGTENIAGEEEQPYLVQITKDDPSTGYVLVQLENTAGLLPLPQEGEYTKTIRQAMPDGSEMVNRVHVAPEGFYMEESNCEGQDCIGEGEVTLANRQERILGNMVICLPHRLMLYLITRAEAEAMLCSE